MTIHKKPVEEREHEVEKYQFIKEQVRPQQKKKIAKFAAKIFSVFFLAVVFGSVAGVVFHLINKANDDKDISDYIVETLSTQETKSAENNAENNVVKHSVSPSDLESIDNYDHVSKEIAAIGNSYKYALVKVRGVMGDTTWYDVNDLNSGITYGAIFNITRNECFVVTDSSAVNGTDEVTVEFYNGDEAKASVLGVDSNVNLAVLRVTRSTVPKDARKKIMSIDMGSISGTSNGSNVIAIGAPNGIMYSVMLGKVIKSDIEASIADNQISLYSTDMACVSTSNGIVLNTDGQMIGFINNKFQNLTGEKNMAFVSVNSVHDILELLMRGKNTSYLGIEGVDVDSATAEQHNLVRGIYVTSVYLGSPAYMGGMRVADVIVKVDGQSVKNIYALHNTLIKNKSGKEIKVEVSRKIKNIRKDITLSITLS